MLDILFVYHYIFELVICYKMSHFRVYWVYMNKLGLL